MNTDSPGTQCGKNPLGHFGRRSNTTLQIFSLFCKGGGSSPIPDICPFWYTAILFTPKSAQIRNKIGQNGPKLNFEFSVLEKVHYRQVCGWDKYQLRPPPHRLPLFG